MNNRRSLNLRLDEIYDYHLCRIEISCHKSRWKIMIEKRTVSLTYKNNSKIKRFRRKINKIVDIQRYYLIEKRMTDFNK